jgi:hypothetical protein
VTMKTLQSIEVLNAIYGRRAVRRYTSAPMDARSIEELIDAAIQAPSAMNLQPWEFAVVLGAERLHVGYPDEAPLGHGRRPPKISWL